MRPSLPPLISRSPRLLQARADTLSGCPFKICAHSPLCAFHTNTSPSPLPLPPLAKRQLSGFQAMLLTLPLCPGSLASSVPSKLSHRQTLPSSPQLASCVPSGLHATQRILV